MITWVLWIFAIIRLLCILSDLHVLLSERRAFRKQSSLKSIWVARCTQENQTNTEFYWNTLIKHSNFSFFTILCKVTTLLMFSTAKVLCYMVDFYYRDNSKFPDTIVHYEPLASILVHHSVIASTNSVAFLSQCCFH